MGLFLFSYKFWSSLGQINQENFILNSVIRSFDRHLNKISKLN